MGVDAKGKAIMRPAFGGLRPSAEVQLERAKSFTAKNAAYLRSKGIPINKARSMRPTSLAPWSPPR